MSLFDLLRYLNQSLSKRYFSKNSSNTEILANAQTKDMLAEYPKYLESVYCSPQTLQHMRNKRLKELLIYAKSNSPWYKKTLKHIDVENVTEERLSDIPTINKAILMNNWDELVTDRRLSLALAEKHLEKMRYDNDTLYLLDQYHVLATSGSSGTRGVFIYNWDEWNKYYLHVLRFPFYNQDRSKMLIDPNKKLIIAQIVITNSVYAMYSASITYKYTNVETFYFPMTLPLNQIIEGLHEIQADIVQGTPSTIHKLCLEALKKRLFIQPKIISVGGEPLYKPIRQLIKKAWPYAHVFNAFGSSEGLCGLNCRADSEEMHLNDDTCIVEPVDEGNNRVAQGVIPNKLYLTNLYNYTLPLIRYESSDQLLFLDKTCDCGIHYQLIAEPQGRPEFDFIYPGNIFVHHLIFVTPLLLEKNIREYQVIQTKDGADIKILSIGRVDKQQLQNNICTQLSHLGVPNPKVNLIEVAQFDYPPSGKLRRFLKLNQVS